MVLEIVVGVGVDLEDEEGLRGEEPVSICFSHDNYTHSIIMPSGFAYRASGNVVFCFFNSNFIYFTKITKQVHIISKEAYISDLVTIWPSHMSNVETCNAFFLFLRFP